MASITCGGNLHMETTRMAVAHLNLDIVAAKLPSELAITEITEQCSTVDLSEPSSPDMDTPRVRRIDPPRSKSFRVPDSPTSPSTLNATGKTARPSVSRSISTTNSTHHSRSTSRSTGTTSSRPPSRHSSFHSSRRPGTTASIVTVPARTPQQEKRESLLALHRESCRLFQDPQPPAWPVDNSTRPASQRTTSSAHPSRQHRTSSEIGSSSPPSPIASSSSSRRFEDEHRNSISSISMPPLNRRDRSNTLPITPSHVHSPSASSIHVPATVMEWTSTSTRRREYEKIDRASRGIHGLWRKVAPRWCQTRESRIPFFEEGKTSREGSVRRFRMDLPDDEPVIASGDNSPQDKPQVEFLDFQAKNSQDHSARRLWTGRRSKTSLH